VPDYCSLLTDEDEQESFDTDSVHTNAWFGPLSTVSPLHHDPYHNLLAQVVGCKYVRIYGADQSHLLYPRPGKLANNRFEPPLRMGCDACALVLMQSILCGCNEIQTVGWI